LGQVIEVFHQLLVNDGQDIHPLYMNLNTRPNFAKRLGVCMAGVADGRGLSDVIVYGEGGEIQDELPEGDLENVELGRAEIEALQPFDNAENLGEEEEEEEFDNELPEDSENTTTNGAIEAEIQPNDRTLDHDIPQQPSQDDTVTDRPASIVNGEQPADEDKHESENNNLCDEEDDLIDYSDDELEVTTEQQNGTTKAKNDNGIDLAQNGTSEDFVTPCLKPSTCFCSKCILLIEKEYETINENLEESRRQRSRSADESIVEKSEQFSAPHPEHLQEEAEATDNTFAGEYEYDHDRDGDKSSAVVMENLSEVEEPVYENEDNPGNLEYLEQDHENGEGINVVDPDQLDSANNENDGANDEEFHFFEGELDLGINQEGFEIEAETHGGDVDEAQESYASVVDDQDFLDIADSSATVSAGEPQQEDNFGGYDDFNGVVKGHDLHNNEAHSHSADDTVNPASNTQDEYVDEDEIDYQEIDGKAATSEGNRLDESPKNNGLSKRPISEVDVDELLTSTDKG
jgi:hypothetical protein